MTTKLGNKWEMGEIFGAYVEINKNNIHNLEVNKKNQYTR